VSLLIARAAFTNDSDASAHTIAGTRTLDRANGGTLIVPAGSAYPGSPVAGELFWRTDESTLYRRNSGGTAWEPVPVTTAVHANEKHDPDMLTVGDSRSDTNLDILTDGDQDYDVDVLHRHVRRDKSKAYLWDDFVGKQFEDAVWATTVSGSGSSAGITSNQGGVARLVSGGAAARYAWLVAGVAPAGQFDINGFVFEARVVLGQTGTASQTYVCVCTSDGANAIGLQAKANKWYARVSASSVHNDYDTGVATDTNWHILRIESSTDLAKFYIDGVLKITRTTGLPTSADAYFWIEQYTLSGAVAQTSYYDWVEVIMDRS